MELDSSELLKRFVAADVGIGFISRSNVEDDVRAKVLACDPDRRRPGSARSRARVPQRQGPQPRSSGIYRHCRKAQIHPGIGATNQVDDEGHSTPFPVMLLTLRCLGRVGALKPQEPSHHMSAVARPSIAIKVTGSKRYPEAWITTASGLQMGSPVNDDDFKMAARRLGDMGVFTDIGYSFS